MNWKVAFAEQAASDWRIYKKLNQQNSEECHKLHYLLMASEKLAKSYLYLPDTPPKKSHTVFDQFIHACGFDRQIQTFLGFANNKPSFVARLKSIRQTAFDLIRLAPGEIDQANVEYPWTMPNGLVMSPCKHTFLSGENLSTPRMAIITNFIERLIQYQNRAS